MKFLRCKYRCIIIFDRVIIIFTTIHDFQTLRSLIRKKRLYQIARENLNRTLLFEVLNRYANEIFKLINFFEQNRGSASYSGIA